MKNYLNKLFFTFCILIGFKGICSDSAYLYIGWYGSVDKPYYEFVFYKTGGYNPEQERGSYYPFEQNPFILQIALSESELEELRHILFKQHYTQDSTYKSDSLIKSYYYINYFEGKRIITSKPLKDRSDFIRISNNVTKFFKGTEYEEEIKQRWIFIFERLGLKPN